jgi:hypothetical protein
MAVFSILKQDWSKDPILKSEGYIDGAKNFTSIATSGIIFRCAFAILGVEEDENSWYPSARFAGAYRETGR